MQTSEQKIKAATDALQQAVTQAISKKKKLGEFAIINRNNQPYEMPADELPDNLKTVSGNE
jgi:hypothetical protein